MYTVDLKKKVYTYAIGLPRQAVVVEVEDGSLALCGRLLRSPLYYRALPEADVLQW